MVVIFLRSQATPDPLNITPEKLCSIASCFVTIPISTLRCLKILLSVKSVSKLSSTLGKFFTK